MKPSFKLALLTFSILSASPAVLAQNYSGTVGDLNAIFEPPMNINGTLCDQYVNTGDEHAYKACSDGVSASRWMAEKYAKNTGKYLGCLDGFYQGITDGFLASDEPTAEMRKQADLYVKGAKFDSADSRGMDRAKAEGQTASATQIIDSYRAVLNQRDAQGRQVLPDKTYQFPEISFKGFEDGYDFDMAKQGMNFDAVYKVGWVTPSSAYSDRIAARKALALQTEFAKNLCNQTDTIFGRRNMPNPTLWDFFSANRQINFQNYGWRNPDWAWEIFDRDERTLEQYQTFTRLQSLEKTVTQSVNETQRSIKLDATGNPVRKLDAAGQPAVDAQGKPVFEYEEKITGSHIETKRVKLSQSEIQALADIYIKNFKIAYDRFYARQYASINYNLEGVDKYKTAKIIGQSIGVEVAGETSRREAYNIAYQRQSGMKYAEEVKRLYKLSFDHLMDIFENNAVVELNEVEIIGQTQDGIFRPGEELKVQFTATNLGEKAAPSSINFESTADLHASQKGFSFTAPVLTRTNFVTNTLGTVSDQKEARTSIQIGTVIRNPGDLAEVAKSLKVRKDKTINLNDYTEIDGVTGTLSYLNGSLSLVVQVKNPSKNVESPISIVEANLNGFDAQAKNVEPIGAGQIRQVVIDFNSLDPLAVIIAGSVNGSVNVRLGNKIAHRQGIEYKLNTDRSSALVAYLDALATKRSSNTGREGKADRQAKLYGMMEELVKGSIEANVLWEKRTDSTIIAVIQNFYNESKRAGRIDKEAQDSYDSLATILAGHVNDRNFAAGGGLRLSSKGNKEAYLKQLAKFSKISTKLKDWEK